MASGGVGGQLDRLRAQAAKEAALLANINTEGGKYHGEETLNQLQETLSSATQATSNFLEGHQLGRNFKGNVKNWGRNLAIGMQNLSDYAADEADRTPTNPGQLLGWTVGNIGRSREQYTDAATDFISQLKIGGKPIDPRITRFATGEVLDTLATAGAGGLLKGAAGVFKRIPNLPTGKSLVPVGAEVYDIPYGKLDEGFKPSNVFEATTSKGLWAEGENIEGIASQPAWISRIAQQEKVVDRRSLGRMDPLDDAQSFLHEPRFGRSFYGVNFNRLPLEMKKDIIKLEDTFGEQVQLHHWNPKLHTAERNRRMIQLIKEGKADWDDYVNLHLVAEKMNAAAGGGVGGLVPVNKSFHTQVHQWLRKSGLEYTGKPRLRLQDRLSRMNTADELVIDLLQDIDEIVRATEAKLIEHYGDLNLNAMKGRTGT